jgi:hypothetical protein
VLFLTHRLTWSDTFPGFVYCLCGFFIFSFVCKIYCGISDGRSLNTDGTGSGSVWREYMLKILGCVHGYLSYFGLTGGSQSTIENIYTRTVLVTGCLISGEVIAP